MATDLGDMATAWPSLAIAMTDAIMQAGRQLHLASSTCASATSAGYRLGAADYTLRYHIVHEDKQRLLFFLGDTERNDVLHGACRLGLQAVPPHADLPRPSLSRWRDPALLLPDDPGQEGQVILDLGVDGSDPVAIQLKEASSRRGRRRFSNDRRGALEIQYRRLHSNAGWSTISERMRFPGDLLAGVLRQLHRWQLDTTAPQVVKRPVLSAQESFVQELIDSCVTANAQVQAALRAKAGWSTWRLRDFSGHFVVQLGEDGDLDIDPEQSSRSIPLRLQWQLHHAQDASFLDMQVRPDSVHVCGEQLEQAVGSLQNHRQLLARIRQLFGSTVTSALLDGCLSANRCMLLDVPDAAAQQVLVLWFQEHYVLLPMDAGILTVADMELFLAQHNERVFVRKPVYECLRRLFSALKFLADGRRART